MRTVLTLPSQKKALVEIPMARLFPPGVLERQMQETPCCESKIVVAGGNKKVNADLKRMVDELEEAYERDVQQLTAKNDQLQAEKTALGNKYAAEISRINEEFSGKARTFQGQLQTVRGENTRLQSEIRKLVEEKDLILRSKISEFRQQEYLGRIAEQDQVIRLRQLELRELLAKLEVAQVERARAEEQILSNRLKFQTEISRLSLELTESSRRYAAEQSTHSFASKLKEEDSLKAVQELRHQLQLTERTLRESQIASDAKERQIASQSEISRSFERQLTEVNRQVEGLKKQIEQLQNQLASQKQNNVQLQKDKLQLSDRLARSNEAVTFLDNEKGRLLLELGQQLAECDHLRVQLAGKQRVYEVKVQRVIDGKQRIDELQGVVFELQQQMKLLSQEKGYLSEDLKKRQAQIDELTASRLKLEGEIAGMRAFIAKREGSFRWAVEREIEKDLAVSGQNGQLYKVSQVGEYWREAQQPNKFIAEQIAMGLQSNLFGAPQQIVLESDGQ